MSIITSFHSHRFIMEPFLIRGSLTGTWSLTSETNNSWQPQLATIWGLRTWWMLGWVKHRDLRPRSRDNTLLSRNNTAQTRPTIIVKSNWSQVALLRTCRVFTTETTHGRATTLNQQCTSTGTWPSSQVPSSWSLRMTSRSRTNWSTTMITWV